MERQRLEKEIRKLFEEEKIGMCAERFLNTTFARCEKNEELYLNELRIRLLQGGYKA